MYCKVWIVSFILSSMVLCQSVDIPFPIIVYWDPFTATFQDNFGLHHPSNYEYYVEQMAVCGFNVIHTGRFGQNYIDALSNQGLTVTTHRDGGNSTYIHKGYQEIWPIGQPSLGEYEQHISEQMYDEDNIYSARCNFVIGTTSDDPNYLEMLVSEHNPGIILDGSDLTAGYWRAQADIFLRFRGFIDNVAGTGPEDPVVTFYIYESDNTTREIPVEEESNHPDLSDESVSEQYTLASHSFTFTVSDFSTPGEWEMLATPFMDDLNVYSNETNYVRTHVDMEWHGNVDFYLDGFELRSEHNRRLFVAPNSSEYISAMEYSFNNANTYNGAQNDILYRYYYDEPFFNMYRSLGKTSDIADSAVGVRYLSATAGRGVRGVEQFNYIDEAKPQEVLYNYYPIRSERLGSRYTSHNSDNHDVIGNRTLQEAWTELRERIHKVSYYSYLKGKPFMHTVQVQSEQDMDVDQEIFRNPLTSEISAQVWMALAHNAKGIMYFLYSTGEFGSTQYNGLVTIDVNGNSVADSDEANVYDPSLGPYVPNEKYFAVKKINRQLAVLGPTIVQLDWKNSYSTNTSPDIYNPDPAYSIVQSVVSNEFSNPYIEIGQFVHQLTGEQYFILVNRRCCLEDDGECIDYEEQTLTITLNTDGGLYIEDILATTEPWEGDAYSVAYRYLENGENTFHVRLKPGEGRLFRLTENGIAGEINSDYYLSGEAPSSPMLR